MKITSILQYSTIDIRFLKSNLENLSKISDEVIVTMCTHLFNGDEEPIELIIETDNIIKSFNNVRLLRFSWDGTKSNTAYYHNLGRKLGTTVAKNDILFFVDTDEIVDSNRFIKWFETEYEYGKTYWLTCYWYFREPIYRSKTFEGCGLLILNDTCNWNLNIRDERQQFHTGHNFIHGGYNPILVDAEPIMHHFSWVRTKDDMLRKVKNWGHQNDTNWISKIENEFSREFNGTDFVHRYQYDIVENRFNL
jgi:hypothetical protein